MNGRTAMASGLNLLVPAVFTVRLTSLDFLGVADLPFVLIFVLLLPVSVDNFCIGFLGLMGVAQKHL